MRSLQTLPDPSKRVSEKGPKMVDFGGSQVDPMGRDRPPPENDLPIYILSRARGVGVGREKSRFLDRKMTHF